MEKEVLRNKMVAEFDGNVKLADYFIEMCEEYFGGMTKEEFECETYAEFDEMVDNHVSYFIDWGMNVYSIPCDYNYTAWWRVYDYLNDTSAPVNGCFHSPIELFIECNFDIKW